MGSEELTDKNPRLPIRGVLAVIGAFLINLILGAYYSFGNIMPYLVAYMRERGDLNVTYSDFASVNLVFGVANGFSLGIAPVLLIPLIGYRITIVLGSTFFTLGPLLTRFTLDKGLGWVMATYGVVQGLGNMALISSYVVPMLWFPNSRGTVMGFVVCGYGLSTTLMNPIQIALTNPNNVKASNITGIDDKYFTSPDVIDRVPDLLLYLSLLYAVVLTIAFFMVTLPPSDDPIDDKETGVINNLKDFLKIFASEILTRREYYYLILTRLAFTILTFSLSTYYKAFALTFINSDAYITTYIGTVSGVIQCIGRFFYGFALDRIPYRIVLCFQTGLMAVLVGTLYWTSTLGKEVFTIWMYLLYATFPGIFSILPARCVEVFGSSHGGVAVGTLALSDFASTAIVRIASSLILKGFHINYFHYFLFVMSGPISGFIVSAIFPPTDGDRARMERLKKGQCCSNEKEQEVRSRHEMENMPEQ